MAEFYLFRNTNSMRLDFHLSYLLVNNDISVIYYYLTNKIEKLKWKISISVCLGKI